VTSPALGILEFDYDIDDWNWVASTYTGIAAIDSMKVNINPNRNTYVRVDSWYPGEGHYDLARDYTLRTDEYGSALLVVTIYRFW